ncbi:GMC family oxidoreductase [Frigidibacter sp. MR17.14]|uniref:GMC family oxidoreductase n=1 Tax=Frigidibacter sp. MR17.14 TaxID=3126509 RepID=UPI003012A653
MSSLSADVVVVGAGATGSVVTARLAAARPEARIVLIEAGGATRHPAHRVPILSGFAPFRRGISWDHVAERPRDLPGGPSGGPSGGVPVALLQGRVLGGSSEINGMVVSRGAAEDYALWQRDCGDDWSPEACLAAFRGLETSARGGSEWHGDAGEMHTRPVVPAAPLVGAFLAAAGAAGQPVVGDLNAASGPRFGLTDVNIHRGRRHSARRAFLPRLPGNVRLLAGRAERLTQRAGRITGVALQDGRQVTVAPGGEVVLCCGAVLTARLLLDSGYGPGAALAAAGRQVVEDVPELGQNLQNHPSFLLRAPTRGGSLLGLLSPLAGAAALARYLAGGGGPLGEGLFQAAGYFAVPGTAPGDADAQVVMSPALFPADPRRWSDRLPRRHGASFAIQQGRPHSRGAVLPVAGGVRIDTGALADPRDTAAMLAAVAEVQRILATAPFRDWLADPAATLAPVTAERLRATIGTAYHMAGTCRMGRDAGAVCDPRLRFRAAAGLRIADASVMPVIPNAALHLPSLMIAARAAAFLLEDG